MSLPVTWRRTEFRGRSTVRDVFRVLLRTNSGYSPDNRRCCDVGTEFMLCNAGKLRPPGRPCLGSCGLCSQKNLFDREPIRVSLWRTKRHWNAALVLEGYESEDWEPSNNVLEIESIGKKISFTTFKAVNTLPLPRSLGVNKYKCSEKTAPSPSTFSFAVCKGITVSRHMVVIHLPAIVT